MLCQFSFCDMRVNFQFMYKPVEDQENCQRRGGGGVAFQVCSSSCAHKRGEVGKMEYQKKKITLVKYIQPKEWWGWRVVTTPITQCAKLTMRLIEKIYRKFVRT